MAVVMVVRAVVMVVRTVVMRAMVWFLLVIVMVWFLLIIVMVWFLLFIMMAFMTLKGWSEFLVFIALFALNLSARIFEEFVS